MAPAGHDEEAADDRDDHALRDHAGAQRPVVVLREVVGAELLPVLGLPALLDVVEARAHRREAGERHDPLPAGQFEDPVDDAGDAAAARAAVGATLRFAAAGPAAAAERQRDRHAAERAVQQAGHDHAGAGDVALRVVAVILQVLDRVDPAPDRVGEEADGDEPQDREAPAAVREGLHRRGGALRLAPAPDRPERQARHGEVGEAAPGIAGAHDGFGPAQVGHFGSPALCVPGPTSRIAPRVRQRARASIRRQSRIRARNHVRCRLA